MVWENGFFLIADSFCNSVDINFENMSFSFLINELGHHFINFSYLINLNESYFTLLNYLIFLNYKIYGNVNYDGYWLAFLKMDSQEN